MFLFHSLIFLFIFFSVLFCFYILLFFSSVTSCSSLHFFPISISFLRIPSPSAAHPFPIPTLISLLYAHFSLSCPSPHSHLYPSLISCPLLFPLPIFSLFPHIPSPTHSLLSPSLPSSPLPDTPSPCRHEIQFCPPNTC